MRFGVDLRPKSKKILVQSRLYFSDFTNTDANVNVYKQKQCLGH